MYKDRSVCVIIPVYNEEKNIASVIENIPEYLDEIIVIDDKSTDSTKEILSRLKQSVNNLTVIQKDKNEGAGSAKRDGYLYAKKTSHHIYVTLDGDGQMNSDEIQDLIDPIINDDVDFTKANRLIYGDVHNHMPKHRFWGNAILTLLTKIASGYWHVTDAQTGFTACNRKVIKSLPFEKLYTSYGYPNQILVMLNIFNFRVKDISSKPIYNVGETSHINIGSVGFKISWLLWRSFLWRMREKYIIRDFHPLVFFYLLGFGFLGLSTALFARLFYFWGISGQIPSINALAAMFSFVNSTTFLLFAMWFDMDYNKDLK